ncbi:hypothetical protein KDA_65070 [Dictyobacter alpinus]|uniref:Uncharacterized protein n=1 Tax=Dictyobacter alpinus TaxID=2014873 RepID=A0A402BI26_9CHLR|nr:hypothetical protein KDA_65070 [Dictyobacter alpinus]
MNELSITNLKGDSRTAATKIAREKKSRPIFSTFELHVYVYVYVDVHVYVYVKKIQN